MRNIKDFNKPSSKSVFTQGYYTPSYPEKYSSKDKRIIYRSSLELKFCKYCDLSHDVVSWESEPFSLPYIHPFKGTTSNYWIDFIIKMRDGSVHMIEVKPRNQFTMPKPLKPNATAKQKRSHMNKVANVTIVLTKAKFAAAYAAKSNINYTIISENFFRQ